MIIQDAAQRKLDEALARYRKEWDRGYLLSQRGRDEEAQRILDRANAARRAAEAEFDRERGRS